MTYPQFRGEGHGTAVMRRATHHILADQSFDLGMLFCSTENVSFYERFGWSVVPDDRVVVGPPDEPEDDQVMTLGDTTGLPATLRLDQSW